MLLLLVHRCRSPRRHGLTQHAPTAGGGVAACRQACETEWARGGPRACVGQCCLWSGMGVSGVSSGAPSDVSIPDRMSRR